MAGYEQQHDSDANSGVDEQERETRMMKTPTTAELFATVQRAIANTRQDIVDGVDRSAVSGELDTADTALSELERRMGAMARAIRMALDYRNPAEAYAAFDALREALTDAPPVFTLEEVDCAPLEVVKDTAEIRAVREHLAALRRQLRQGAGGCSV